MNASTGEDEDHCHGHEPRIANTVRSPALECRGSCHGSEPSISNHDDVEADKDGLGHNSLDFGNGIQ